MQAFARIEAKPRTLVVAGHSAGGALAADYAAIARTAKLPVPVAVFSAYPGRTLPGVRVGIPEFDPGQIPAGPDVVALAGTDDTVVGSRVARRIARHAGATTSGWWSSRTPRPPTTSRPSAPTPQRAASSGTGSTR